MQGAAVLGYILAEGLTDAMAAKADVVVMPKDINLINNINAPHIGGAQFFFLCVILDKKQ